MCQPVGGRSIVGTAGALDSRPKILVTAPLDAISFFQDLTLVPFPSFLSVSYRSINSSSIQPKNKKKKKNSSGKRGGHLRARHRADGDECSELFNCFIFS